MLLGVCCLALILSTLALHRRFISHVRVWPWPWGNTHAAVFGPEEVRKIWEWEVLSGHYPSTRSSEYDKFDDLTWDVFVASAAEAEMIPFRSTR